MLWVAHFLWARTVRNTTKLGTDPFQTVVFIICERMRALTLSSIQIPLKTCEHLADFVWLAEVGHGVGDGIVIFQAEQWGELSLVQFLNAYGDVVG